jgi:epidermal growth factor receptor substrate 15
VAKGAFDDLDDDFEGLEDAKEGSADDEFANVSRSNLDDFNPVFDSSPPPSQAKSESTNVSNAFGHDSSFDFGNASTTAADLPSANNGQPATTAAANSGPKPPEGHDWDAIFASLDEPTSGSASAAKAADDLKPPTTTQAPARPITGRALTEDGVHDDPILKNLTSMGYSRADALSALEKYDYNLERVSSIITA